MARTETAMSDEKSPDIWMLIFEQTPAVLRWLLGFLTLGIFTMLSILYKWHRQDLERIQARINNLETNFEHRLETLHSTILQIHVNTSRRRDDD